MKKRLLSCVLALYLAISCSITAFAGDFKPFEYEGDGSDLIKGHATAYCLTGITASGEYTRDGICASLASRLGKSLYLYQRLPGDEVGKCIGYYECKDTGGKSIQTGKVIDVWQPDMEACQEFMNLVYEDGCGGKVWIKLVDAVG